MLQSNKGFAALFLSQAAGQPQGSSQHSQGGGSRQSSGGLGGGPPASQQPPSLHDMLSSQEQQPDAGAAAPAAGAGSDGGLAEAAGQLWVDQHAPLTPEDLAVHPKKVRAGGWSRRGGGMTHMHCP